MNPTRSTKAETVQLVLCRADMPLRRTRCVLLASLEKLAPQMSLLCITETPTRTDIAQILSTHAVQQILWQDVQIVCM
jgi:hypothetical protein